MCGFEVLLNIVSSAVILYYVLVSIREIVSLIKLNTPLLPTRLLKY